MLIRYIARGINKNWALGFKKKLAAMLEQNILERQAFRTNRMLKEYQEEQQKLKEDPQYREKKKAQDKADEKLKKERQAGGDFFGGVKGIDDARKILSELGEKVQKESNTGKPIFEIIESPDKDPLKQTVNINQEYVNKLWEEIKKDEKLFKKLIPVMHDAFQTIKADKPDSKTLGLDMDLLPALSRDSHRIDLGLVIMRPPLLIEYTKKDLEWMKYRLNFMSEYYVNYKALQKDVEGLVPSREEYIAEICPQDPLDPSEYPTHRFKHPDGTVSDYYAASKNFKKIDPHVKDRHCLHYAPNNRVYFLVKNKVTGEWEFPIGTMLKKQTIPDARQAIFDNITKKKWEIIFMNKQPIIATRREFSAEESKMMINLTMNGVRAYYFMAFHKGGVPSIESDLYEDFAWVPKAEINKYLPRDLFEEFKYILWTT